MAPDYRAGRWMIGGSGDWITEANREVVLGRLLANVIEQPSGCWEWQRSKVFSGYGRITVDGRMAYAHRVAYELLIGPVPVGLMVLHRCDNPPCANPTHLFLGTNADNMADMDAKGRRYAGRAD